MSDRESRFQRLERDLGGLKAFTRRKVIARLPPDKQPRDSYSSGEFLGHLWALFGPTKSADKGFAGYRILDTTTGREFTAYSGASGPAYRADEPHDDALMQVLVDFEALLAEAPLADCAIEYRGDDGRVRIGVAGGVPFDDDVSP